MSIIKQLFNETTISTEALVDFLNNVKSGTFLGDCTITREVISANNVEAVYIVQEDPNNSGYYNKFSIHMANNTSSPGFLKYEYLDSESTVIRTWNTTDTAQRKCFVHSIMYCDNGFILTDKISSSNYQVTALVMTVGSDGNLCALVNTGGAGSTTSIIPSNGYAVVCSKTSSPVNMNPSTSVLYGTNRTCLSPISVPQSEDPTLYLPYVWTATQTQLSAAGNTAVRINNNDYITNGMIYVKDSNE